jgi:RNA polymerase sigma-70 factor (ECF subfamily)
MDETVMNQAVPVRKEGDGEDEILIALVKEQDQAALSLLYDRRGGLIYSLVYRMLGNAADSEEVTQDVFLRVWNNAGQFDPKRASALGWMVTVARHLAIDRMRSRLSSVAKKETPIGKTKIAETVANGGDNPHTQAERSQAAAEVSRALNALDENHRTVIDLSYFEGLSHAKIAERLGAPLGTVKTRMRSAITQLREMLSAKSELK